MRRKVFIRLGKNSSWTEFGFERDRIAFARHLLHASTQSQNEIVDDGLRTTQELRLRCGRRRGQLVEADRRRPLVGVRDIDCSKPWRMAGPNEPCIVVAGYTEELLLGDAGSGEPLGEHARIGEWVL